MTIQTMMRAIHMTKIGGPEVLQLAHVPRPSAQANEVLIRLSYSGVNYNDYMVRTDFFRHPGASAPELPLILGEEGAGIVEAVGSGVDGFTPGQRVGFFWDKTKTYAEYAAVPAEKLFVLPDDISEEVAVALIHSGLTARASLYEYRPIEKDMPVLITGASGSIGSVLVPWASQLGAKVIATVTSATSADWVKQLGAAVVVNVSHQDLLTEVKKATDGAGVELALDGVGGEGFHQVFDALSTRGTVVPFGVAGGKYPSVDPLALIDRSRNLSGFMFYDFMRTRNELLKNINMVFDAYRQGWIKPAIAGTFPLEAATKAHRLLESRGRKGTILLKI